MLWRPRRPVADENIWWNYCNEVHSNSKKVVTTQNSRWVWVKSHLATGGFKNIQFIIILLFRIRVHLFQVKKIIYSWYIHINSL